MALRGMIFDIDGTLVDTNPAHVEAWRRAFARLGYDVPRERIEVETGKGGDLLVPSILGEDAEKQDGEFQTLCQRGIRTALATSREHPSPRPATRHPQSALRSRPDDHQ